MYVTSSAKLLTLYGPLAIHSYGLLIAIGIAISMYCIMKHARFTETISDNAFIDTVLVSIVAGIIGGRFLEVISDLKSYPTWYDCGALWEGGFSALGSIIGVVLITPLYLKKIGVPILPLFDLAALYAPLFQSIARLGCFAAGCCYGVSIQTKIPTCIAHYCTTFHGITLHPTQLYSSLLLFFIFLFMTFVAQNRLTIKGQLFTTYLMLTCAERFVVDFWRADRILCFALPLSLHQMVALTIFLLSGTSFLWISYKKK